MYWWAPESGYLQPVAHHDDQAGNGAVLGGSDLVTYYPPEFADVLAGLDR